MKIRIEVGEYDELPPFYYGLTRHDYSRLISIFHIIPINFIIRLFYLISYKWNRFRTKETWFDIEIKKAINDEISKGAENCIKCRGQMRPMSKN